MNKYLQTVVFGTEHHKSQHAYIKKAIDASLETISMSNNNCRKCFKQIDGLIDIIFNDIEDRSRFKMIKDFAQSYSSVMEKLWIDTEYKTNEIDEIQIEIDRFMVIYKDLYGKEVTNYFHYLDAGHVSFFLKKYNGNIMQYANQGWEGLNAWFKMVIKTKTQRGGYAGKSGREYLSTACLKFSQRRLIWIFGYTGPEVELYIKNKRTTTREINISHMVRVYSSMRE